MLKTSRNILNKSNGGSESQIKARKRVWVGMSGGVDSSVSAYLLKKAGYDVTGVFIKVWQPENGVCTWKDERRDAMRVAAVLDIPFLTFDFSEKYKKEVVDYMISEYKEGKTPNPDVMCNRHIKFGSFLDEALKQGVDFIATGHYAQNINGSLVEGADMNKDQSYFIWTLGLGDLKHILFPVGHLQKNEVRKIAEKAKLPIFDKKDSQGICFLGHVDMKEFLKEFIETKKGDVLDIKGNVVGEHDGALLYTIGERHGFTMHVHTADSHPQFVLAKDVTKNTLTVGEYDGEHKKETEEILPVEARLRDINWAKGDSPDLSLQYSARSRYRQEKQSCRIRKTADNPGEWKVIFDTPQKNLASGQSLVIYDGKECLGGAIIV